MSHIKIEEGEPFIAAMQLCHSNFFVIMMKAVVDLGVFDVLAMAGPNTQLTAFEIAGNLPVCSSSSQLERAASMLDNILGYLSTHSIFTCTISLADQEGRSWKQYGLTPVSRLLAKNDGGLSLAPLLRMSSHKALIECGNQLKEAVQEGVIPFEKAHGVSAFEYMAQNPSFGALFNESMAGNSSIVMEKIAEEYDGLKQVIDLVDVGGGVGASLKKIISKHPHIKGINFDLPHVVSQAPSLPGVQHIGGDMLAMIPSGGAIFLKWILHDWSDEKCLVILKNCWRALPTSGKVIIVEQILPEFPEKNNIAQQIYTMNAVMMICFNAKERTEKEFRSLAQEAGFSEFKVSCKILNYSVMEFVK